MSYVVLGRRCNNDVDSEKQCKDSELPEFHLNIMLVGSILLAL